MTKNLRHWMGLTAMTGMLGAITSAWAGQGVVSFLKGKAKVKASPEQDLALGGSIPEGAMVTTFKESRLEMKLDDGSLIRLGPNSSLVLKQYREDPATGAKITNLHLEKGKVWLNVARVGGEGNFTVSTRSAVAAVKGTVFRADVNDAGETQVNAYDGTVEFKRGENPVAVLGRNEMVRHGGTNKAAFGEAEDAREDKDGWLKWNKSRDKLRVLVIVAAFKENVLQKFDTSDYQNHIYERLGKHYIFEMIDKDQLDQLKDEEKIKAALQNPDSPKKIAAAGLVLGADVVISVPINLGKPVELILNDKPTGRIMVTPKMSEKAVQIDTAKLIAVATVKTMRPIPDVTEEASTWNVLKNQLESVTDELIEGIKKNWEREVKSGTEIQVVVSNVDFKILNALETALSQIQGVKKVEQITFKAERALLILTTELDTKALNLEVSKIKGYEGTVIGMSMNKIELDMQNAK